MYFQLDIDILMLHILCSDEKSLITGCDGSKKDGPAVFADFYEIKRPCTCIVTPSFVGELLVTSKNVIISSCTTRVSVSFGIIFGCALSSVSSQTFVKINHTVNVQTEYIQPSTTGTFYHCVWFQQNSNYALTIIYKIKSILTIPNYTRKNRTLGIQNYPILKFLPVYVKVVLEL